MYQAELLAFGPPSKARKRRGRKILAALTVVSVMMLSGYAVAAWLLSSNVTGYGKVTTLSSLTSTDISATVAADLVPQAAPQAIHIRLSNPNGSPLTITSSNANG